MTIDTKIEWHTEKRRINDLLPYEHNPRQMTEKQADDLRQSLERFNLVEIPAINTDGTIIAGHQRIKILQLLGRGNEEIDVRMPNRLLSGEEVREYNVRSNLNVGEWDYSLLANFDESFLMDVGFTSQQLDDIFHLDIENPEQFDLQKELEKMNIKNITTKRGDIYQLGGSRLMCGDSTIKADVLTLMDGRQADMCLTDPPYMLDYLHGKRGGKPTVGFGAKKNRRYLETETLPDNFTEIWMDNIAAVAKPDFSIIVYENWKNLRTIWGEMEKHWKVKNMIVWHVPNRHQGFAAKYKFFSKYDIAMVGASGEVTYNHKEEPDGLQEEYETALYAISNKPHWESYERGKRYQPTDFIEYRVADEKQSGQSIIFGVKPLEILIPYIKVLTKRNDLIIDPFCGSGSTLIAAIKLGRHCYTMEKSPVYTEVALKRWEKFTGKKARKV